MRGRAVKTAMGLRTARPPPVSPSIRIALPRHLRVVATSRQAIDSCLLPEARSCKPLTRPVNRTTPRSARSWPGHARDDRSGKGLWFALTVTSVWQGGRWAAGLDARGVPMSISAPSVVMGPLTGDEPVARVAAAFARAVESGRLDLPLPGGGRTRERWAVLAELAGEDLSLARLAEGHADALAILAELGAAGPAAGSRWGVWAAQPPG